MISELRCKKCGKIFDAREEKCPYCRADAPTNWPLLIIGTIFLVILWTGGFNWFIGCVSGSPRF